jgi:hypothetical protein
MLWSQLRGSSMVALRRSLASGDIPRGLEGTGRQGRSFAQRRG